VGRRTARRTTAIIAAALAVWGLTVAELDSDSGRHHGFWESPAAAASAAAYVPGPVEGSSTSSPSTTSTGDGPAVPDPALATPVTQPGGAPVAPVVPRAPDDPGVHVGTGTQGFGPSTSGLPVIGRLVVPRLGLDTTLYDGAELAQIDHGPSHYPGTAMPGRKGNTVIAGHRVTHTAPFRGLGGLQPGDTATFAMPYGTFTYEYVYTDVVVPEAGRQVVAQGHGYTATLFACHPPGSEAYRIVTHWRLISQAARGPDPDPPTFDANGGGSSPGEGGTVAAATTPPTTPRYGTGSGGGAGYFGKATTTTTTAPPPSGGGTTSVTSPQRIELPRR
jgi:sortase A